MDTISIFIPTKNRPEFLSRLLRYYHDTGFQGPIFVGDSSDPEQLAQAKLEISGLKDHITLAHLEMPDLNSVQCVQKLIEMLETPYAAFVADDDFLVPSALEKCAEFLDDNPDYSAAHGLGSLITVEGNAAHGSMKGAGYFKQPIIEDDAAGARFTHLFQDYAVTMFSLQRLNVWQSLYRNTSGISDWWRFGSELIECGRTVIAGKVKQLDCLHMIRQVHQPTQASDHDSEKGPNVSAINMSVTTIRDTFDWITNPRWAASYKEFSRLISEELAEKDHIEVDEAALLVKQSFWKYLSDTLNRHWNGQFAQNGQGMKRRSKNLASNVPGIPWAFNQWRSARGNLNNRLSVEAMLRPSSPFHSDFMPIYRAISTPVEAPVS